jgi:hypothetical protein
MNALLLFLLALLQVGGVCEVAYMTAKITYVRYPIDEKETGVIITTIKLKAQFAEVDRPLAGARIFKGTISAG